MLQKRQSRHQETKSSLKRQSTQDKHGGSETKRETAQDKLKTKLRSRNYGDSNFGDFLRALLLGHYGDMTTYFKLQNRLQKPQERKTRSTLFLWILLVYRRPHPLAGLDVKPEENGNAGRTE